MDYLGARLLVDLPFIGNVLPFTSVLVDHTRSFLAFDNLFVLAFLDNEPFLKVPLPSIKMGLILGSETFSL
jgi:hypothetical protein